MSDDQTLNAYVAGEIRASMARQRVTGRQLAQRLGVSHMWISYRLTETTPIQLDDLQRIATALGVQVTDLLPTPVRPIRTAYPDSSERSAPHAPDVRSRPVHVDRTADAGSRTKRAFWTHA